MRRLAKKEAKEQKYNRLIGVDDMGYTNTDNPFGDNHLTESFVWKKVLSTQFKSYFWKNGLPTTTTVPLKKKA